jgi:hypothetical protein
MRITLIALLLLASATAGAEWTRVAEQGGTAYHMDAASIVREGDLLRVDVLQDHATPEARGVRSRRVSYEVDCTGQRLRSVAGTEFAEPMAAGPPVHTWTNVSEWLLVAPRTGSHVQPRGPFRPIVTFACSR